MSMSIYNINELTTIIGNFVVQWKVRLFYSPQHTHFTLHSDVQTLSNMCYSEIIIEHLIQGIE